MQCCEHCSGNQLVEIDGHLTCTDCGTVSSCNPVFTWSYEQSGAPLQHRAVYNRTKRFIEFIRGLRKNEFMGHLDKILDLYNQIEFYFSLYVKGEGRKYFYSRKVILFYIAKRLGIEVDLPLLKDRSRNESQIQSILDLRQKADDIRF